MSLKREVKVYKNKIFLGPSQRGGIRVKMTPKIELGIEIFKKGSLRKGLYSKWNKD